MKHEALELDAALVRHGALLACYWLQRGLLREHAPLLRRTQLVVEGNSVRLFPPRETAVRLQDMHYFPALGRCLEQAMRKRAYWSHSEMQGEVLVRRGYKHDAEVEFAGLFLRVLDFPGRRPVNDSEDDL